MDSRLKPTTSIDEQGKVKKKYCDKVFKKHLTKALKTNLGEPGFLDKIRGNKYLEAYSAEKIVEFVNGVAKDIQSQVDESMQDPGVKDILSLAKMIDTVCESSKPQELPLVMKLKSETEYLKLYPRTNGVNFVALNKFLYSAVSGLPDCSNLDPKSQKILFDTHAMLMQQIEHDATPEFLQEMKSKICAGSEYKFHPSISNLAQMFNDETLNPFNFPFEYLLNGTLPTEPESLNESISQANNSVIRNEITSPKLLEEKKEDVKCVEL